MYDLHPGVEHDMNSINQTEYHHCRRLLMAAAGLLCYMTSHLYHKNQPVARTAPWRRMSQPFTSYYIWPTKFPSSLRIIRAPLVGFHKETRVRWTPHCEPLTSVGQQKVSRRRRRKGGRRDKNEGWTERDRGYPISPLQGDSDATDEFEGGGGRIVWPHSTCLTRKSRPEPLCWTTVAMDTALPSGTRSAGNQLKVCVCVNVCVRACVCVCAV